MSKIIKFPENVITTNVDELKQKNLQIQEEINAFKRSQIDDLVSTCQHELMEYLELQGFDIDNYDFIEHYSLCPPLLNDIPILGLLN